MLQQAIQAGDEIPDFIANKPKLTSGLEIYLQAYWDLDTDRSHSMGPTAIPFSSIVKYAEIYEFSVEEMEDLLYHIRRLDAWNLNRIAKLQKVK